jgi:hypothetical protein
MRMRKCQKRPTIWQKRPIARTKETYRYTILAYLRSSAPAAICSLANVMTLRERAREREREREL